MYVGKDFSDVNPGELIPLTLDFVNDVPTGSVISAVVWTCKVTSGNDDDAGARLIGDSITEGTKVTQKFTTPLGGVRYCISAAVTLALGSEFILYSHVLCRAQV